ncbi:MULTISPECIES: hypothetical protein [unclassified Streptomyces]
MTYDDRGSAARQHRPQIAAAAFARDESNAPVKDSAREADVGML